MQTSCYIRWLLYMTTVGKIDTSDFEVDGNKTSYKYILSIT